MAIEICDDTSSRNARYDSSKRSLELRPATRKPACWPGILERIGTIAAESGGWDHGPDGTLWRRCCSLSMKCTSSDAQTLKAGHATPASLRAIADGASTVFIAMPSA